jgi:hypothetical protein
MHTRTVHATARVCQQTVRPAALARKVRSHSVCTLKGNKGRGGHLQKVRCFVSDGLFDKLDAFVAAQVVGPRAARCRPETLPVVELRQDVQQAV